MKKEKKWKDIIWNFIWFRKVNKFAEQRKCKTAWMTWFPNCSHPAARDLNLNLQYKHLFQHDGHFAVRVKRQTHKGGESHRAGEGDACVYRVMSVRRKREKNSGGGDPPSLKMKGQKGLEEKWTRVQRKSYLSSLREPWHQAPPAGPPVKACLARGRGDMWIVVSAEADVSRDERVRTTRSLFTGLHWGEE